MSNLVSPDSVFKSDRRKDIALYVVIGGSIFMSMYAVAALWFVKIHPQYVFWLGALAMAQIMLVFTGIMALLVKRTLSISKSSLSISDFVDTPQAKEVVEEALDNK